MEPNRPRPNPTIDEIDAQLRDVSDATLERIREAEAHKRGTVGF